jgi:hypothetical protein
MPIADCRSHQVVAIYDVTGWMTAEEQHLPTLVQEPGEGGDDEYAVVVRAVASRPGAAGEGAMPLGALADDVGLDVDTEIVYGGRP